MKQFLLAALSDTLQDCHHYHLFLMRQETEVQVKCGGLKTSPRSKTVTRS